MSGVYVPTEPGSGEARAFGCTCPGQGASVRVDGTASYELADGCPLHRLEHAFSSDLDFAHARFMEGHRERQRAGR